MILYDFLILACLVDILYIKNYKIFFIENTIGCQNHLFNLKYKYYCAQLFIHKHFYHFFIKDDILRNSKSFRLNFITLK